MIAPPKEPLSLLVSSCDKYEDAWVPFFGLLDANWPDCNYPIYLNTESKEFPGTVCGKKVQALHTPGGRDEPWSKRLARALKQIPTEFVLFLLEDFFLLSPVNTKKVEDALAWMQADPNIVNICFYPMEGDNTPVPEHPGFSKRDKNAPFLIQCQVGIWRKKALLKLLRSYEDAWNFESDGTIRARKRPGDYYCLALDVPAIFPYLLAPQHGYGIYNGKWLWNDKPLFQKFGIEADFSKRETIGSIEELQTHFKEKSGTDSTDADKIFLQKVLAEEEAYQNSFRYKLKSHLPAFFVGWILNIKKKIKKK